MTGDATVVCTKCGFLNGPGDQFCGSCGAFLEWEGSVAGAPAGAAPVSQAPGGTGGSAGQAGGGASPGANTLAPSNAAAPAAAWTAPAGGPGTPGAGAAGAGPVGTAGEDGLVRCPACGVANTAARTFCQSCGARLATASKVAPKSREEIAAAVAAASSMKASAPVTAPVTSPGTARGTAIASSAGGQRSSGLPLWVVLVVLAGVLVGVGVIVVPQALHNVGPVSVASTAPSPGASGPGGASASTSAARSGSASGAPASPKASVAAVAKPLHLTSASASSVLLGNTAKYGAANAIDGDPKTSWQEGATVEKGQWLEVAFDPATVTALQIRNGYGASTALYKGNLRLKDVQISIDGGTPITIRLKDVATPQRVDLPATAGATRLRITIVTTYPSVKTSVAGTPFDDAAVSDVSVLGIPSG